MQPQQPPSTADSPLLSRLCLDCLRKSSVRGLPRILTSESRHLQLLWIAAVVAFTAGLLYNLAALTIAYRRGDIVITERPHLPRPPFPSITVCDASPVPSVAIDLLSISPMAYREKILARLAATGGGLTPMERNMLTRELLNPLTYFNHLHRELVNLTGRRHSRLVLPDSCHVHAESGGTHVIRQCGKVHNVNVPGFLSCSTIEPAQLGETVTKVTFHVLLDSEIDPLECKHCVPEHTETMRTGAILFVHEMDAYPIEVGTGMYVVPGTQEFVLLKSKRTILADGCSEGNPEHLDFAFFGRRLRSKYSAPLCRSLDRYSIIRDSCGCASHSNPHRLDQDAAADAAAADTGDLPSCAEGVLGDSPGSFDGVKCIMKIDMLLRRGQSGVVPPDAKDSPEDSRCPEPCRYLEFTTVRSASRGVTKYTALDIYKNLVANTSAFAQMQRHLQPYETALRLKAENRLTEARQVMEKVNYLEQNFLTVTVWFPDKMSKMVVQQYIISLESYIGQVGGLLSLFSGITVVCIAELMELLLSLCCRFRPFGGRGRDRPEGNSVA